MDINNEYGLKRLQEELLAMMKDIDEICRKNGIKYCLTGGSVLGAVRHKGFIPWDDDLDIAMLKEEYEKFCEIAPEAFKGTKYFLQNIDTEKEYNLPFAKIRNSETTDISEQHKKKNINHGIWIDVFIIDAVSKNRFKQFLQRKSSAVIYAAWSRDENLSTIKKGVINLCCKIFGEKQFIKGICKLTRGEKTEYSKYVAAIDGRAGYIKETMPKEFYTEHILATFEDVKFPIPKQFDAFLSRLYGDYMTPPPYEKRGKDMHKAYILDLNKSYREYM